MSTKIMSCAWANHDVFHGPGSWGFQWVDVAMAGVLAAVAGVPAFPVEALLPRSGVVTAGEAAEGLADVPDGAVLCAGYGVGSSPTGGVSPLLG
ncbi:MAG TPA: hypothetical protein VFK31_07395 [Rhodanobacteraceae bacterium]|nr:hypothetical protein [Rhodanobacteraceae bacterium]